MAERETVHVYCASRGHDVSVYVRAEQCLDVALDLVAVLGGVGAIIITGDGHRESWSWRSSAPSQAPSADKST